MIGDPVPEAARIELERLGGRWRTLPLDQALRAAPALRALARAYADEIGAAEAATPGVIADLGPAAAYDQLVTLTYDAARALDDVRREQLADELARLRRGLAG